MDKTMWIPILLITSLPGAVWAETYVTGFVGRTITIDCPYAAAYRSNTKYWCRGRSQCTVLVETNGQHGRSGRVSITDNPTRGIFTVTVVNLQSEDTGWYSCRIRSHPNDPRFDEHLQVSDGAVWAETYVTGFVGRAITIDCHYGAEYRSHTKYWCQWRSGKCGVLVETNGQHGRSGRVSITDNPTRGIFTVAVEDLHSGDTGWHSCGITAPGEPTFKVHLQVSVEPVSVPVLGFLSPANVSCVGGSVSVSCESGRGSLPISYSWHENIPAVDSKISDNSSLDLHCQSFKHQHHQYYCNSSNQRGSKSSEMVNVSISSNGVSCSFLVKINGTGLEYSCETLKRSNYSSSYIAWTVGRWLLFLLLVIWCISIAFFTRASKRRDESEPGHSAHELQ
ncbi:uncharacterized protein LOC144605586 [Rhinoraja longicauda]